MFNVIGFIINERYMKSSFSGITCQQPRVKSPLQIATDPNKLTFQYNESIEYRCDEGYNLNGSAVQHCTQNGTLQQKLPSCSRINFFPSLKKLTRTHSNFIHCFQLATIKSIYRHL